MILLDISSPRHVYTCCIHTASYRLCRCCPVGKTKFATLRQKAYFGDIAMIMGQTRNAHVRLLLSWVDS